MLRTGSSGPEHFEKSSQVGGGGKAGVFIWQEKSPLAVLHLPFPVLAISLVAGVKSSFSRSGGVLELLQPLISALSQPSALSFDVLFCVQRTRPRLDVPGNHGREIFGFQNFPVVS